MLLGLSCLLPSAALADSPLPLSDDQTRATVLEQQRLHVAWVEQTGNQHSSLFYQLQDLSGHPISPQVLIQESVARIRRPHVVVDASQRIHLLWQERFAKEAGAKLPQGTWVHYAQLTSTAQGLAVVRQQQVLNQRPLAMHPALAIDAQGIAYVVWEEGETSVMLAKIVGRQRPVEFRKIAASFGKEGHGYPTVAIDRKGNLHLAWTNRAAAGTSQIVYTTLAAADLGGKRAILGQPLYATAPVVGQPKQIMMDEAAGRVRISWQNRRAEGPLGRLALPVNSLTLRVKGSAARLATPLRIFDTHLVPAPDQLALGEQVAVTVKPQPLRPAQTVMVRVEPQGDQLKLLLQRFDNAIEKLKLAHLLAFSSWSSAPPSSMIVSSRLSPDSSIQFVPQQVHRSHQFKPLSTLRQSVGADDLFSSKEVSTTRQGIIVSLVQTLGIQCVSSQT